MEGYVTTTYRLHGIQIYAQGGYVTITYFNIQPIKSDAVKV